MNDFALDWLRRRAPFDRQARDIGLARRFAAALPRRAGPPLRLLDIGAGSGANFRVLAPILGGDQEWTLIDKDTGLLGAQAGEHLAWAEREGYRPETLGDAMAIGAPSGRWIARGQCLDLALSLDRLDGSRCDGLTMAAFIDLASASWLDAFVARLAAWRKPLLAVLSVDGRRLWHPQAAEDAVIAAAFTRHQEGDKGFGPASGGAAPFRLAEGLRAQGFTVDLAPSDWQVSPDHRTMLAELIASEAAAAVAARPDQRATVAAWAARRRHEAAAGVLSVTIGHRDLLALPPLI